MKINILIIFLSLLLGTSSFARIFSLHNNSSFKINADLLVGPDPRAAKHYQGDAKIKNYFTITADIGSGFASLVIRTSKIGPVILTCQIADQTADLLVTFENNKIRPQNKNIITKKTTQGYSAKNNIEASKIKCK